jgi:hypothetical protein
MEYVEEHKKEYLDELLAENKRKLKEKEIIRMREPERIDRILDLMKQIWMLQPDSRFMQMMSNISWNYSAANNDAYKEYSYSRWDTDKGVIFNKDVTSVDLFHLEDNKFEMFLQGYLGELS